jgi:hypothetical protein
MPESETLVIFRILGFVASAGVFGRTLPIEQIAEAAHLTIPTAACYMTLLEHARAVQVNPDPTPSPEYGLTAYGFERLGRRATTRGGRLSTLGPQVLVEYGIQQPVLHPRNGLQWGLVKSRGQTLERLSHKAFHGASLFAIQEHSPPGGATRIQQDDQFEPEQLEPSHI